MNFGSFLTLSLPFFVLCSCRPAAAATLAVSPVKRGIPFDPIDCPGPLPRYIPPDFPRFENLLELCSSRDNHPRNLGCLCVGEELLCGSSHRAEVWLMISQCYDYCICGPETKVIKNRFTKELNYEAGASSVFFNPFETGGGIPRPNAPAFGTASSTGSGTGSTAHTCSKTCTSVNRGCPWTSTGDCKCYAPPVSLFFWHSGGCGPVHHRPHSPKRDLAQQRHAFYLNATAQYASPNKAIPPGTSPDLPAQLGSGMLPSPCNASYVSFACVESLNGIVHEPLENWLGALVPEDAKQLPPVPELFLRIHGGKEEQVIME